ncbi:hypothetical protein ZIOFF_045459 [Zingiber officinale]|uniref:Uncharacterized protein n=1 Tax=Zingiber officinale TaxID=94328 RepID=A0A8J5KRU1_ZINOF|nr:hypothetical protein ZIOFF_045459 [Zingiber officinale]
MKCSWHPWERGVGVCASCLRERLLALTTEVQVAPSPELPSSMEFPRSVSPYASRVAAGRSRRSYSSILSSFFGRRGSGEDSSWLPDILRGRRKKKKQLTAATSDTKGKGREVESPASGGGSGFGRPEGDARYDVASAMPSCRLTPLPMRAATAKHRHQSVGGELSGYGACCSPLVTAGASRQRSWAAEVGTANGVPRLAHHRRHESAEGPLLRSDLSRKLSDLVKFR